MYDTVMKELEKKYEIDKGQDERIKDLEEKVKELEAQMQEIKELN